MANRAKLRPTPRGRDCRVLTPAEADALLAILRRRGWVRVDVGFRAIALLRFVERAGEGVTLTGDATNPRRQMRLVRDAGPVRDA